MEDVNLEVAPAWPDRARQLLLVATVAATSIGLMSLRATSAMLVWVGWYGLSSVVPAGLLLTYRPGRRAVQIALAFALAAVVVGGVLRYGPGVEPFHRDHDGGVVATGAAAEMVLDGVNPYATQFTEALVPDHDTLDAVGAVDAVNPLVEHYPYLPAAFLVHVPFVAVGGLLGGLYDVRMLYAAVTLLSLLAIARGPADPWRRAAALAVVAGNMAIAFYLPWGTTDAAAAGLVVVAALAVRQRPLLAGALLAVGISFKALVVVALIPLGVVWFMRDRAFAQRAIAATVGVLVITCLPYLIASPSAFVDDTVRFNLGGTELHYPTSGFGLGATHSGVVNGGVLIGLSAVLVLASSAASIWWVRRVPRVEVALFVAGLVVLAGLLPARTFHLSYLTLIVLLWGPIWLLRFDVVWPRARSAST